MLFICIVKIGYILNNHRIHSSNTEKMRSNVMLESTCTPLQVGSVESGVTSNVSQLPLRFRVYSNVPFPFSYSGMYINIAAESRCK